ncbi:4-hydroxythreonine-4-phosphate dehydrogenase [Sinorhizobium americanum]|uniref:1-(5-phosphoribosyl)-5-[(5-phosphoribosylamino)methylideneamino] imidazole-4-carboxamide isomerase n=1 Tax=Sinorhizobium americanum TaxID=194963 RepID=A0A4V2RBR4_9HYPH|nr:4-hydroxythreonine-4-phosphate dehydrogenase [Sinorhizobium americanum]TCN18070.1 1-(5-phosphoribosyl)-5-[(5-phosphoribosylamino)methylideneamino] imidazole-4-carboxamide isomerase [Sinorhizobium americanum]
MTPIDFIFMLTRNDRTIPDALAQLPLVLSAGVRHIGFKDIGLPFEVLSELNREIRAAGAKSYLEVVSLDRASEIASVRAALTLGVDYLLGGTHVDDVLPLLKGSGIRYYPFPGRIVGHPSVLEGSTTEIVASAKDLAGREGVHGLDLLAYRADVDVANLIRAVCDAVAKPVIVAGSIDRAERIHAVVSGRATGFTVGTAALEGRFPAAIPGLTHQLLAISSIKNQAKALAAQ